MAKNKKNERAELLRRLWQFGRQMSTQTVFLHQAIAQTVGLNATDTKCIDSILQCGDAPATAGYLSQQSGLTTGAITHILDRLEKRGYITRERDTEDRRRIFVRVRPESLRPLAPKYEAIGRAYMTIFDKYSDKELEFICQYLEKTSEISKEELGKLIEVDKAAS